MNLQITEKKDNKLLGRVEVTGVMTFEGSATPTNEVVRDTIAAEMKSDKELVIVKRIIGKFSYQEAEFLAYVYADEEKMGKMEVVTKHLKKKAEADAKAVEEITKAEEKTTAEEKKEEAAPAEEKTEDKPVEKEAKE